MDSPRYRYLTRLALRLGGQITQTDTIVNRSPFCQSLAVDYEGKVIYHTATGWSLWGLVHEMAHVFACDDAPDSPFCEEWNFLGWEIQVMRKIHAMREWRGGMEDYGITYKGEHRDFGDLTWTEQNEVIVASIMQAKLDGTVGKRGQILTCR